ncbi:hypothetical protein RUM44_013858 [Polyplax serrata]|uniref:Uncharacterized protein n=1 Tax=Polyplax serrata TaxID=468196 RepID=A0ABR1BFB9_POLSC
MHEKLGEEGRRVPQEDACSKAQEVLRLLEDCDECQKTGDFQTVEGKKLTYGLNDDNSENKSRLNGGDNREEKLTWCQTPENSRNGTHRSTEDENGTKSTKNKQWTNKVDGVSRIAKGNVETDEQCQPLESNVRNFFSNLLKFSLKRFYNGEDGECGEGENEDEQQQEQEDDAHSEEVVDAMGNLQAGESKKSKDGTGKSPAKRKGGFLSKKSPGKDAKVLVRPDGPAKDNKSVKSEEFLKICEQDVQDVVEEKKEKVVSPEGIVGAEDPTVTGPNGNVNSVKPDQAVGTGASSDAFISTDSWRQVQCLEANRNRLPVGFARLSPQSRESSSESVFTDPLTPRGLAEHLEVMKSEKATLESGSSTTTTTSKTSTLSQRQDTEFDGTSSLEDITLMEDQMTDTEADDSITIMPDKERSLSMDVSEGGGVTSTASAPLQRPTSFTIHKHKMVDLEPLTSSGAMISASQDHLRRYGSVGEVPGGESNVLRKVASLTLDKNTIEQKVQRPKFVPEKLDFQLYEKFEAEGKALSSTQLVRT